MAGNWRELGLCMVRFGANNAWVTALVLLLVELSYYPRGVEQSERRKQTKQLDQTVMK